MAHKPWILVVEDNPEDRLLLFEAFHGIKSPVILEFIDDVDKLIGYLNYKIRDSKWAYNLPSFILLDYYLPRGYAVYTIDDIKAEENYKNIPIIVMSGMASQKDLDKCVDKGAILCLKKPNDYVKYLSLAHDLTDWVIALKNNHQLPPKFGMNMFKPTPENSRKNMK